ncbi:sensory rhodopsin transducer [Botryobacter ruber]|uniref:sensory rhodopsin transducer n=1 Tax=Botryobacter ruber TaxID=2171629 RepID=UPI000E0BFC4A|nr:sensory rhodopsin transducer [Botryobacter ruber]
MKDKRYGKKYWAFSGGYIPVDSTGKEPEYVSKDIISILNTTSEEATVSMTFYFTDTEPAGTYQVKVKAQRVKMFSVNDLIEPFALPLGVPYGGVLESDVPVVVQLTKQHTGQSALALMGITAYPADNT